MKNRCLNCNELQNVWHNKQSSIEKSHTAKNSFNVNLFCRPDVQFQWRKERRCRGEAKIYTFPLNIQVICVPFSVPFQRITIEMRIFATFCTAEKKEILRKSINKTFRKEKSNKLYHVRNFLFLELFIAFILLSVPSRSARCVYGFKAAQNSLG